MAKSSVFPALQASNAFAITPSDTVDIVSDAGNTEGASFVFLHCTGVSGTARVLPAGQTGTPTPVTVYLTQGQVLPLAVKRLYNTGPTPPTCIGFYAKGNI
jgi:hypothetical protein